MTGSPLKRIRQLIGSIKIDFIYFFSYLVPVDKNLWVFGAWFGEKYADNSKYLFEYVNEHHPEIRAVWLTRNEETLNLIKNKGYEAYTTHSLKGYSISLRANLGVLSTSIYDINENLSAKAKTVQLWHGTGLKKAVFDHKDPYFRDMTETLPGKIKLKFFPFIKREWENDLYAVASESVRKTRASAFRASPDKVLVTGTPRTDIFFNSKVEKVPLHTFLADLKAKGFKIGIYMPTRSEGFLLEDLKDMEPELKDKKIFLLIKLHYRKLGEVDSLEEDVGNVRFIRDEDINQDIYTILKCTDFLITDYSSTYTDYLLLDKPIIFFIKGIHDFLEDKHSLWFDYWEVTPGPKAKNWQQLVKYMDEAIKSPDEHQKDRERIRNLFHYYQDGGSSERVFKAIFDKLQE